jgi:hypothetical protein
MSKLIDRKTKRIQYQSHLNKILKVKSELKLNPSSSPYRSVNRKKEMLNEVKLTEIERENRILFQKMSDIMKSKTNIEKETSLMSTRSLKSGCKMRDSKKW